MASLNTSTNGPSIKSSYQSVINGSTSSSAVENSSTYGYWVLFSVSSPLVNAFQPDRGGKESTLKVQTTGEGEILDLIEEFSEGRIQFAFVRVRDPNTKLPKFVLIGWCGEGVPERTKGYFTSHLATVSKICHGYHIQINARSDRDISPEQIIQKVSDASGAKYSGRSVPSSSAPSVSTRSVFNPTQALRGSETRQFANLHERPGQNEINADDDGWGADAPQITQSKMQNVASSYKPTKVNMAELISQKQTTLPARSNTKNDEKSNIVKGGYQPVGKVDISAIRAQAQSKTDDRPTIIKGAYEPVGKVDIAAIRSRAQKPIHEDNPISSHASEPPTVSSAGVGSRSALTANRPTASLNSERLTTLPKPKVANKFGSSTSNFSGTKAPTPSAFGFKSASATTVQPSVGSTSKKFADEGGKTPAQVWQEKKDRETKFSGAGNPLSSQASPSGNQSNRGGEWKSGYTGKSWAPVSIDPTGKSSASSLGHQSTGDDGRKDESFVPSTSSVGTLRDRIKSLTSHQASEIQENTLSNESNLPPINISNRPIITIPSPPPQLRTPTPENLEKETSPIRIALPKARVVEADLKSFEKPYPSSAPNMADLEIGDRGNPVKEILDESRPSIGNNSIEPVDTPSNVPPSITGMIAYIHYDYEKAEENELELVEGEYVTNIDMVDDDWWMGTNSKGENGLFPSNYVELMEREAQNVDETIPTSKSTLPVSSGPTATALYAYEAGEDNELSFEEDDIITNLEFPDEDWWQGTLKGNTGLFPSNYVQLNE
ncbi:BgTH12-01203 [Blumeria graminis f. sp. triticale]|uniref:Class E vacuolar protein-sorting machinery protein HSE1 n=3 Tax=Blumeria graminis TaxID=34373 RepID=A0A9X9QFU8_BLUGR|nr:hypothetical protein BGT96224_A21172 [Blumeria graminis f. sp. tritici 96224]CAD6505716.1 BgTH12-01203 [Blumeria graminis f. sp. triticale]VDB93881.1 BgtA-21172 [Blumeria graminis f. sp. tritici]